MTRLKSFVDLIAGWSTYAIVWILDLAMNDLIEIATLVKEIAATLAFIAGIWYTIHRLRKGKK